MIRYNTQLKLLKQKTLTQIIKEFIISDLFAKRKIIMNLLIYSNNYENKYLSYLLYDLLSSESNGNIDTTEQVILFDSFPWEVKTQFKDAMLKTIQYTNEISNFDINKIPLEQQICLMKVTDVIKEKAMMKLKEIKSKTEDSGSKARQYLDGLLKIPFSIFRKEPIMNLMDENRQKMQILTKVKTNITNIEIKQITKTIKNTQKINTLNEINAKSKKELMLIVKNINPNYKFDKKTKQDLIL